MATKTESPVEEIVETKTRLYLLSALAADASAALEELTKTIKGVGGAVEQSEDLGLRRLAFPIAKKTELSLVSVFFNATPKILTDLSAELTHSDKIARYLVSMWQAGLDEQGNKRPRKKSESGEK